MSRFFIHPEEVQGGRIVIRSDQAHHIRDVLRLGEGDAVTAFDGTGWEYQGRIERSARGEVAIGILKKEYTYRGLSGGLSLAQAIPKGDRMDWLVGKATELGAASIIPMVTERSVVRPVQGAAESKRRRWERIAVEACKQCGRTEIPKILPIASFSEVLGLSKGYEHRWLACLDPRAVPIQKAAQSLAKPESKKPPRIFALIGPEGDFTPKEIQQGLDDGFTPLSLGGLVFRSETAGLYMACLAAYWMQP